MEGSSRFSGLSNESPPSFYFLRKTLYELVATMQPVVTGQAPMTLERKVTSGGKANKKRKIIHTRTETNRIRTSNKKKVRSAYVRIMIHIYIWYMLNESQQKPKPRRQHYDSK